MHVGHAHSSCLRARVQSLYLTWVVFKFDWTAEAVRAKALIAAGELDIELEDELVELTGGGGGGGIDKEWDRGLGIGDSPSPVPSGKQAFM